jgi:hypothetical protein
MTDQTASTSASVFPLAPPSGLAGKPAENTDAKASAIRRTRRLAAIYGGTPFQYRTLNEPKYRKHIDDIIYLLDLPGVDLSQYDAVMIPDRMHPERLLAGRERIDQYLNQGGTVIAFGEQPAPVLPGIDWEYRPTNFWWWLDPNASSGLVLTKPEHGLFNYIDQAACTWHQHGVFTPPEGAETLVSLEDGGVVMYVDQVSTPGTMLVTCLDPISHYGSYFMPATERFLDGFLPWVSEELLGK